jgi:hypothetical protein
MGFEKSGTTSGNKPRGTPINGTPENIGFGKAVAWATPGLNEWGDIILETGGAPDTRGQRPRN